MNEEIPIVEVYESEKTYEMVSELYYAEMKEQNIDLNKPESPLERLLINILGFVALNALTFLITDIIRGAVTGTRPQIWWFFYGPWYYITSAPLINNIVTMHRFFQEIKDNEHNIKPTPEEQAQHVKRCGDDLDAALDKCCTDEGGVPTYDKNGVKTCDIDKWSWGNPMNDYNKCRNQQIGIYNYCLSFETDAMYDRARKMQEDHPYLFDLFYLFNYGELPPTADVPFWWPF